MSITTTASREPQGAVPTSPSALRSRQTPSGFLASSSGLPLEATSLWQWFLLALAGATAVIAVGLYLRTSTVDLAITSALNEHRTGVLGALATGLYLYLEPPYAAAVAVLITALVAYRKGLRRAAVLAACASTTWLPVVVLKMIVTRPRPEIALLAHPIAMKPGTGPSRRGTRPLSRRWAAPWS